MIKKMVALSSLFCLTSLAVSIPGGASLKAAAKQTAKNAAADYLKPVVAKKKSSIVSSATQVAVWPIVKMASGAKCCGRVVANHKLLTVTVLAAVGAAVLYNTNEGVRNWLNPSDDEEPVKS